MSLRCHLTGWQVLLKCSDGTQRSSSIVPALSRQESPNTHSSGLGFSRLALGGSARRCMAEAVLIGHPKVGRKIEMGEREIRHLVSLVLKWMP